MSPEKTTLSTAQVCSILKASAKAGVSELKFGNLHVKFGRPAETPTQDYLEQRFVQQNPAIAPVVNLTEEQHKQLAKLSLEDDELHTREDQLARALVEDPMLYEELLAKGELTDELDDADSDDDE